MLRRPQVEALYPKAAREHIDAFANAADTLFTAFEIAKPAIRLHYFLAQIGHESAGLTMVEENLSYGAKRIAEVWPKRFPTSRDALRFAHEPEALANAVYANRLGNGPPESGDGWRFRGRGYIQLTGRDAYRAVGAIAEQDLEAHPELAAQPQHALHVACAFWQWKGINPFCDLGDFEKVTRLINGGTSGLADRRAWLAKVQRVLATAKPHPKRHKRTKRMGHYYTISARAVKKGEFKPEPGPIRYLKSPDKQLPKPSHEITVKQWLEEVRDSADGKADEAVSDGGSVLIFVHGYNNDPKVIRDRQMQLTKDLTAEGWRGVVASFDWPSDNSTLNYLEDRSDAAAVAGELVDKGIRPLSANQQTGCQTNVHLLGHSTGAYVIMEAFAQSEKNGTLFKRDWRIAQVVFIGGDVSAASIAVDSEWARPMFRRIMRFTNYQNPFDHVLAASNAKRLGVAPRVGRVGLPANPDPKSTNVDCGEYFATLDPKKQTFFGTFAHSWHIGNRVFARDLAMTLEGRIDRHAIPTRKQTVGALLLQDRPRPSHYDGWTLEHP